MKRPASARRSAERQVRRDHILAAAERVFARMPFDQASMQQIAGEAGIGMHGLYEQFDSKQRLYEAVVSQGLDEIEARTREATVAADPAERIRQLATAYAAFYLERPQLFPVFARHKLSYDWGLESRFSKAFDRRLAQVEGLVARAIDAAVAAGLLRPLGTAFLVTYAMGVFSAVVQHALLHEETRDASACADRMLTLLVAGAGAAR